jgi:hypothetical protein
MENIAFEDHLAKACEYGEAGFYFEEGGCIAMALELHCALISLGRSAAVAVDRDACHVYVVCDGMLLDHQGWNAMRDVEIVDESELVRIAKDWHVYRRLPHDRNWAREIVGSAVEMASNVELHPV